ncbi:MAG: inorganic phosphate transporter [Thermogutta sp.]
MTPAIPPLAVLPPVYSSGANDHFEDAATLFGSRTDDYRRILLCAAVIAFFGALTGVFPAGRLPDNFSGRGLIDEHLVSDLRSVASVALAAGLTVLLSARIGMPVSTTHVSCGALFGIDAVTREARRQWIAKIVSAWTQTLPAAALLGAAFHSLVSF